MLTNSDPFKNKIIADIVMEAECEEYHTAWSACISRPSGLLRKLLSWHQRPRLPENRQKLPKRWPTYKSSCRVLASAQSSSVQYGVVKWVQSARVRSVQSAIKTVGELVSQSASQWVSSGVAWSDEKQRTDFKSISGYGWCNSNCSK
jgi:hypothetical protein